MVDSRAKGRTAETNCKNELKKLTGLDWERTPLSGALDAKHLLKGDLYVPGKNIRFCVEVKHYKDDHVSTKLLTGKNPQLIQWWAQTLREAEQINKEPLLIFKHNRSKWFAASNDEDVLFHAHDLKENALVLTEHELVIMLLTDFVKYTEFEL